MPKYYQHKPSGTKAGAQVPTYPGGGSGGGGGGGGGRGGGRKPLPGAQQLTASLMPFFSPEDRQRIATMYSIQGKGITAGDPAYGSLLGGATELSDQTSALTLIPGELTGEAREYFSGKQRADAAIEALTNAANAAGKPKRVQKVMDSPGFKFLMGVSKALSQFGSDEGPMSRKRFTEFLAQVSPLIENARNSGMGQYADIAQALAMPFFSQGDVFNYSQDKAGNIIFGDGNKRLYR